MNMVLTHKATLFYVYKLECVELNKFYIGSHACTKKSNTCKGKKCRYEGSGSKVAKLKEQHPQFKWDKKILAFAEDRESLAKLEIFYIELNINDKRCLNKIVASPSKLPTYTKESKQRLKDSRRRTHTEIYSLTTGEIKNVLVKALPKYLNDDWHFAYQPIWLRNKKLKKTLQLGANTATQTYLFALGYGWSYGYDSSYETIATKEYLALCNLKKVTIVTTKFEHIDDKVEGIKPLILQSY